MNISRIRKTINLTNRVIAGVAIAALIAMAGGSAATAQESMIRQAAQDRNVKLPGTFTVQGHAFHDVAEVV